MSAHLAAQQAGAIGATPRYGLVDSWSGYKVKIVLAPSQDGKGPLTGYAPMVSPWIGNGWGFIAPCGPKDQVVSLFVQNHPDEAVAVGRIYDNNHKPPMRADGQPAQYGELLIVDKSGNRFQLTNDQKALLSSILELLLTGPTITVTATTAVNVTTPTWTLNGNMKVNGTIEATGEITAKGNHTVSAHDHSGVSPGGATTDPPTG